MAPLEGDCSIDSPSLSSASMAMFGSGSEDDNATSFDHSAESPSQYLSFLSSLLGVAIRRVVEGGFANVDSWTRVIDGL
jgi:hypothetical protein